MTASLSRTIVETCKQAISVKIMAMWLVVFGNVAVLLFIVINKHNWLSYHGSL